MDRLRSRNRSSRVYRLAEQQAQGSGDLASLSLGQAYSGQAGQDAPAVGIDLSSQQEPLADPSDPIAIDDMPGSEGGQQPSAGEPANIRTLILGTHILYLCTHYNNIKGLHAGEL